VESQNDLGIYIDRDRATVVCLDSRGKDGGVVGCFSVSVEEDEQANMQTLAGLIAQGCAERDWRFSDVSVALDCTMFMQHKTNCRNCEIRYGRGPGYGHIQRCARV